jgi:hypothetical protein
MSENIDHVCEALKHFLGVKNQRYGNSALNPIGVFNKTNDTSNGILVRIDDKLSRIKNSETLRKNDVVDLMGYLALLCIKMDWLNFDDLLD